MDCVMSLHMRDRRSAAASNLESLVNEMIEEEETDSDEEQEDLPYSTQSLDRLRKISVHNRGYGTGGNARKNILRKKNSFGVDEVHADGKDDRRFSEDIWRKKPPKKVGKRFSLPYSSSPNRGSISSLFDLFRSTKETNPRSQHKIYAKATQSLPMSHSDENLSTLIQRKKFLYGGATYNTHVHPGLSPVAKRKLKDHNMHTICVDDSETLMHMNALFNPRLCNSSSEEFLDDVLSGHEHPYSIKMTRVRDNMREKGSGDDINLLMPMDLDLNDNGTPQFILRQTKKDTRKSSFEENVKRPKKTKRSPIINFFRRSQAKLDGVSSQPSGKLFGHPLKEISQEDSLCKPIMDLLTYLFQNAPFLPGVFRKPGNHKRVQEVRSQLDQGEEIQWEEQHVLVACSILKEFLRSLPDCLLLGDLFDQWVEFLTLTDLEERKTGIIKFLDKLPRVNLLFLRYLICVFYHIMRRSDENHMGAQALAVCISPSLLWQSATVATGNALEDTRRHTGESEKASKLFQFMLEHVVDIFGQETIMLFGDMPTHSNVPSKSRQDSSTDSDSMHSMLSAPEHPCSGRQDTSSIDSLERDIYYTEPEPSPQMLMKSHFSPTNLSRDSGLTNSDPRLYEDSTEEGFTKSPKMPISRSVSHQDQNQSGMTDPGQLSRSYDATLDMVHSETLHPVPPPRNRKSRKGSPTDQEEEPRTDGKAPASPLPHIIPPLHHSSSAVTVSDIRRQMRHAQAPGKRISEDSLGGYLGSLHEDDDPKEIKPMIVHHTPHNTDIGVLKKSSSGTRLYVRDDSATVSHNDHSKRQHRKSAPPEVEEVQKMLEQAKANVHQPRREHPPIWQHSKVTRTSSTPLSPTPADVAPQRPMFHLASSDSTDGMDDSVLSDYTFMVPVTSRTDKEDSVTKTVDKTVPSKHPLVKSVSLDSTSDGPVSPPRTLQMQQPHRHMPITAPEGEEPRPRSRSLLRSNAVDEHPPSPTEEVMQKKGMTSRGADLFPHAMKKLYRKSLDESVIMKPVETSPPRETRSHSSHQVEVRAVVSSADAEALTLHSRAVERLRQGGVERSASDSSLCERMETESTWQRPKNPPSYQEAIQRKACRVSVSPQEIESQRHKNALAKKLYEESLKKLQENAIPRRASKECLATPRQAAGSPPCYETACQRAEQIREQKRERTPPKYVKRDSNSSPAAELVRKNSDQIKANSSLPGSRETTPTRSDSSREGSMNRKHRRRSKDRRIGHRNSDSKLSSPIKLNKQSEQNLNRSKSDSSEHLHRIHKFKGMVVNDNKENIEAKVQPEKLDHLTCGRGSTPERKLEKTTKENENMRRQKLTKSQENISFNVLTDSLTDSDSAEKPEHRKSVSLTRSIKNRNWHKDLAEQYSDSHFVPSENVPKYSYAAPKESSRTLENEATPRRRWAPIVHPTKDLVITYSPSASNRSSASIRRVQSHGTGDMQHRRPVNEDKPKPQTVAPPHPSESPAPSPAKDNLVKPMEQVVQAEEEPSTSLGWSVSQLRSLYAGAKGPSDAKDNFQPKPQSVTGQHYSRYHHAKSSRQSSAPFPERTNPNAEEAYV